MKDSLHTSGWYMLIIFTILMTVPILCAQGQAISSPFNRGINLTNWFQANSTREINFRRYSKKDFENIQSLGCDVIRLPINLKGMTNGSPNYTLDPLFFTLLDSAVSWARDIGMHLILDNHTFNVNDATQTDDINYLKKTWHQMASHYKDNPAFLYYEVLNEPHGISDNDWNNIQGEIIDEIRLVDTEHTIIVGPTSYNSYNNLSAMPVYDEPNLIYTFHFYDPFLFTHQGASWVTPTLEPLGQMPFPYDASSMPALDASFNGTWIESAYNNYANEGTEAQVKQWIDIAIAFRDSRNVPLYCGEFGVYQPNSNESDRVRWYKLVREYLEANDIAWTMWDYHGGFGLFNEGGSDLFEHDLNMPLLDALNFNVPPQSPYEKQPEQTGFLIYDDYLGPVMSNSSYTAGSLDFYSEALPNNDNYNIQWSMADQYNTVGFDFITDKDLSQLVENDYAIDFFVRGYDLPGNFSFDLRFIDTKVSEEDHPWRNRYTINSDMLPSDGKWYHLHLALKDFTEQGAYDGEWFNPQGDFDWKDVDKVEFSTESGALGNGSIWFDNIYLTDQDTARVLETRSVTEYEPEPEPEPITSIQEEHQLIYSALVYPNPVTTDLNVKLPEQYQHKPIHFEVHDIIGNTVISLGPVTPQKFQIDCSKLSSGIYFYRIPEINVSGKFIK